jgi:hypothetical protein
MPNVPSFIVKLVMDSIFKTIVEKTKIDISKIDIKNNAQFIDIPCLFIASE